MQIRIELQFEMIYVHMFFSNSQISEDQILKKGVNLGKIL